MRNVGVSFASHFGLPGNWFNTNGVLNPTIDLDTPLFIDPLLLQYSKHEEFAECAFDAYVSHFEKVYKLLAASNEVEDKAWRSAAKMIRYGEINGTCLGYSAGSVRGRGFGKKLSNGFMESSKQIIQLGVRDIEFFSIMSLFEDNIGSDRISDMTTNIIIDCVLQFNKRVLASIENECGIKVPTHNFYISGRAARLPKNPFEGDDIPIILLPTDILKHLPILADVRDISRIAASNEELRKRVNKNISEIWEIKYKKDKELIKQRAMESSQAFQTFLDLIKEMEKKPYDFFKDPQGLIIWRSASKNYAAVHHLSLPKFSGKNRLSYINDVCKIIIDKFRDLIEVQRLSRLLWVDGKVRPEKFAQLLFLGVASSYCSANDIDISPEADAGAGPVDFKMSRGMDKVVVEIKLSSNSSLVHGYERQLDTYMHAEKTHIGHYVVLDVGELGGKLRKINLIRDKSPEFKSRRTVHLIDGTMRPSASVI